MPTSTADTIPGSQPPAFLTNWLSIEGSHNLFLSFDNLLELTQLRKVLYLLLPAYHKGYNSGNAKWKRYIWQGMIEVGE